MSIKLSYQFVRDYFKQQGCEMLGEYRNVSTKISYICSCGRIAEVLWGNFVKGNRCKACGHARGGSKRRHDPKTVAKYFHDHGCELLEDYHDANTPMRYRCSCGCEDKIRFSKFVAGQRCRVCKYRKISEKFKGANNWSWIPDRQEAKFRFQVRQRCQHMVRTVLEATGRKKHLHSADLLGYTTEQLRDHLAAHPDWERVKDGDWSIDHIFPIKAFLDHGITDLRIINCLENLRPTTAHENYMKQGKYSPEEFRAWLRSRTAKPFDSLSSDFA